MIDPEEKDFIAQVCAEDDAERRPRDRRVTAELVPPAGGEVEGLPERIDTKHLGTNAGLGARGFNECYDEFMPVVTRLTAENARLQAQTADVTEEMIHWQRQAEQIGLLNKANESELTKALELLNDHGFYRSGTGHQRCVECSAATVVEDHEQNCKLGEFLARQTAPAAKDGSGD